MQPPHITPEFEWDSEKDAQNQQRLSVSFVEARRAFADPNRLIYEDIDHSTATEMRYFCVGMVASRVMTVRFTVRNGKRNGKIRIIGAGYWRKERKLYEERNK